MEDSLNWKKSSTVASPNLTWAWHSLAPACSYKFLFNVKKAAENVKKINFFGKNHMFGKHSKTEKSVGFMFLYNFTVQNLPEELDGL